MTPQINTLLQCARDHFGMGVCIDAAAEASRAIALLRKEPRNKRALIDAYNLHGRICLEIAATYRGDGLAQNYLEAFANSAMREIELRIQFEEDIDLARTRFTYGRVLASHFGENEGLSEIAAAMAILMRLGVSGEKLTSIKTWFA